MKTPSEWTSLILCDLRSDQSSVEQHEILKAYVRLIQDEFKAEIYETLKQLCAAKEEMADFKANNRYQRGYHDGEESMRKQIKA